MKKIILSLFLVLALSSCKDDNNPAPEIIRPLKTFKVGYDKELSIRYFPGKAKAHDSVTLAFEVSGKLNKIPVIVGDKIKKGDVLASVDNRDFKNSFNQAKAELKRAEAKYERMQKAVLSNAISKQELSDAEAAYESALAVLKMREKSLEDTELKAPFDGIVTAKYVKSFGNIATKQPVIRIVDNTIMEMVVDVPEKIISYAKKDMEALVIFDAFPNVEISARINEIGAEALGTSRTYPVTLVMNNLEDLNILPGMTGKAWSDLNLDDDHELKGFEIPLSSIFTDSKNNKFIWVVNKTKNIVNKKAIEIKELTKSGVIVKGLRGGEVIAKAGVNSLHENQKIRF